MNASTRIATINKAIDAAEAKASARTIGCVDEDWLRTLRVAVKIPGVTVTARQDGGAVPNSYKYAGESTRVTYGGGVLTVARTFARKVAGGAGAGAAITLDLSGVAPEARPALFKKFKVDGGAQPEKRTRLVITF